MYRNSFFHITIMKKRLLKLAVLLIFCLPINVFAIEYIWTDHQGNRHFDCGGFVVGGKAIIKDLGRSRFRARGVLIDREIQATSIYHAAQIACGERDEYEAPRPTDKQSQ